MPSERVQRQIDFLLDEAEAASQAQDWQTMLARARAVLDVDPTNDDATAFVTIARRNLGDAAGGRTPARAPDAEPADRTPQLPESFVSGRYRVLDFLGEGGRKQVYLAHDTRLDRDVAFALIKGRRALTRPAGTASSERRRRWDG